MRRNVEILMKNRLDGVRKWSSSSVLLTKCRVGNVGRAVAVDFSRTRNRLKEEDRGRERRGEGEWKERFAHLLRILIYTRENFKTVKRGHILDSGDRSGRKHLLAVMPHVKSSCPQKVSRSRTSWCSIMFLASNTAELI